MTEEAIDRIKKALEEKATFLDLGVYWLTAIPEEILTLAEYVTQIDLSHNRFSNNSQSLALLTQLKKLDSLNLAFSEINDNNTRIVAKLSKLTSLNLYYNNIGDQGAQSLAKLSNLTSLELSNNNIGKQGAQSLAKLSKLTSLDLSLNNIGKQGAQNLTKLSNLTSLELSNNNIGNQGAQNLTKLSKLTSLNLSLNNIGKQGAQNLTKLSNLTSLNLYHNNIGKQGAQSLAKLSKLTSLNLEENNIGNQGAQSLAKLSKLTSLDLGDNNIGNQGAQSLAKLSKLTSLKLEGNNIGNQGSQSLGKLSKLTALDLNNNNIENQGAQSLAKLSNLTLLNLWNNKITKASYLKKLKKLTELDLRVNPLKDVPESIYSEVNCIKDIRIWWQETADKKRVKPNKMVKLQVLGNGNAGKSSVIEALRNNRCQKEFDSTHGIVIEGLKFNHKNKKVKFQVWDFGGQEIYHGTHRLFIASQAIHLLVVDQHSENLAHQHLPEPDRCNPDEMVLHQPLQHYIDSSKRKSPKSLRIIIENKIDRNNNQPQQSIKDIAKKNNIPYLAVSATKGLGIKSLKKVLAKSRKQILHYGMPIPVSWLAVRQYFLDNLAVEQIDRRRKISMNKYQHICDRFEVWDKARMPLLDFLHSTGIVYKNETYFKDRIICDQKWALEAIYKPLDRSSDFYDALRNEFKGRVRIKLLFKAFGEGYENKDKWLFLKFMYSCGLCFPVNDLGWRSDKQQTEDSYCIFPEFLPADATTAVTDLWDRHSEYQQFEYHPEYLDYFSIQRFIVALGHKTQIQYIWKNGILVKTDKGLFRLEADDKYHKITVSIENALIDKYLPLIIETIGENKEHWFTIDNKVLDIKTLNRQELDHAPSDKTETDEDKLVKVLPDVEQKIKKIVVSFAYQNFKDVKSLEKQLSIYNSKLELLYDQKVIKGRKGWDKDIRHMFDKADGYIIILSTDYQYQSEHPYIWDCEVPLMLERRADDDIFIYCLPVDYFDVCEEFKNLDVFTNNKEVLPTKGVVRSKYLREFTSQVIVDKFLAEDEE